jgi:hypothetical protein
MQAHLIKDVPAWDRRNSGNVHALSIVRVLVAREPACELASQSSQSRKGENSMKPENEAVPAMKLMKLRIATGLGLVLFMATMIGGPVRVSQAQDNQGGVTMESLAGNFAGRGSGFFTACLNAGVLVSCSSLPVPTLVPFSDTGILHTTRDATGHSCEVITETFGQLSGAKFFSLQTRTVVGTTTFFDPTTGSGTESFSRYKGGSCSGAVWDGTGTQTATGTDSFVVSDSGDRIETIFTSYSAVTVPGSVSNFQFSTTSIRQSHSD